MYLLNDIPLKDIKIWQLIFDHFDANLFNRQKNVTKKISSFVFFRNESTCLLSLYVNFNMRFIFIQMLEIDLLHFLVSCH